MCFLPLPISVNFLMKTKSSSIYKILNHDRKDGKRNSKASLHSAGSCRVGDWSWFTLNIFIVQYFLVY